MRATRKRFWLPSANPGDRESRRFPARPLLGVGALIINNGQVLLVERGRPPLVGTWSLPGGLVEAGERLEDAIAREVFEETGLNVQPGAIATVFERVMPAENGVCEYHYVLVDFYCSVLGGEKRPGDDSRRAEWFAISSLAELPMTPGTREVIELCCRSPITHPHVTRP